MHEAEQVLRYWFGEPDPSENGAFREMWFDGGLEVDAEIRARFLDLHERGVAGELDDWRNDGRHCLALILLFDQFPRNMFRGDSRSFATDPQARELASHAIDKGFDQDQPLSVQQFFYMPFEHSEDIEDQRRCMKLFSAVDHHERKAELIDYALRHLEIIARFARFPHRNEICGRPGTTEEDKFLAETDSRFGTDRNQTTTETSASSD